MQEAGAASEPHRPPSPQANAHSDQGQGPATAHQPLETRGRALTPPPPPTTPKETWALGPEAALQRPGAQASPRGPAQQAPRNLGAGDMETKLLPHLQTRVAHLGPRTLCLTFVTCSSSRSSSSTSTLRGKNTCTEKVFSDFGFCFNPPRIQFF